MYIVVCYDISDNGDRLRLHELLLGYGTAVQKSVFECDLTASQLRRLRNRAKRYVKASGDGIKYYQMCAQCAAKTESEGTVLLEPDPEADFIV